MTTLSARDIGNEMSRHVHNKAKGATDNAYICGLVDLLAEAPANTSEDALAFLVWSTGFLKEVVATMPDVDPGEPDPKYLITLSLVLATRATEALEKVTGIEAATMEGDVRRRN